MALYKINGILSVSCWTDVEAETPEEALKIAADRTVADHDISGTYQVTNCWHFDNDGTPQKLTIDE